MDWKKLLNLVNFVKTKHVVVSTAIIITYALAKAYVLYTPSPHDDNIPDKVRDAVLLMVDNEYVDPDDPLNKGADNDA